jgi:hypothetical protein
MRTHTPCCNSSSTDITEGVAGGRLGEGSTTAFVGTLGEVATAAVVGKFGDGAMGGVGDIIGDMSAVFVLVLLAGTA